MKYVIDSETNDSTDLTSRPPILMNLYSNNIQPYITVIHMWDDLCDELLSSKHNALKISCGESGNNYTTINPSSTNFETQIKALLSSTTYTTDLKDNKTYFQRIIRFFISKPI